MKELKFRFWDNTDRKFIDDPVIDKNGRVGYFTGTTIEWCSDVTPQQYTDCIDKNDKEIYEGDIIKYTNLGMISNGSIRFYAGGFFVEWEDQTDDMVGYLLTSEIEVVGNIFENKK